MEFALTVPSGELITPVARRCVRRSFSLSNEIGLIGEELAWLKFGFLLQFG